MDVSIPYHLVISAGLSVLVLLILIFIRKNTFIQRRRIFFYFYIAPSLIMYFSFLVAVIYTDIYADIYLDSFDLDRDGFFSIDEQTTEQKRAMYKVTSDVGRNFAVFTTAFFSLIVSFVVYLAAKLGMRLKQN